LSPGTDGEVQKLVSEWFVVRRHKRSFRDELQIQQTEPRSPCGLAGLEDAVSIDVERSERRVESSAPPRIDRDPPICEQRLCKQRLESLHHLAGLFRVELEPEFHHDGNLAPAPSGGLTASITRRVTRSRVGPRANPLDARIVFVADAFDTMTARYPWAGLRTRNETRQEIERCSARTSIRRWSTHFSLSSATMCPVAV
jgi:hypothetical protein